jgi:hypothetical protein
MVNSCAVCGCCTRTDIVREHLEDTLRICDVSAKGLLRFRSALHCDYSGITDIDIQDGLFFVLTRARTFKKS